MKLMFAGFSVMLAASLASAQQETPDNPLVEGPTWNELKDDIVGKTAILDGAALFSVTAPYRANDAATVPVTIEQTEPAAGPIDSIKLVIDENPAPLAAEIRFGRAMAPLKFETRVRVNQYSNIRVIAETPQGSFMNGRFVKASGGCSAPATKDPVAALNGMGEMRVKLFDGETPTSNARREAQIMIRHPNYSGLQRDQITQLFISAHFITQLEVKQGDDLLFALDGGISVSENPVFRFSYTDNGATDFTVHAVDTEGNVFDRVLPKTPPV
ncbi:quinoprotein dehydrogenase-associated SoxYZ-like carrier [Sinorhizobium numidicum]|uniref:Quinoprotein dehydrogenase-associated SoxYZ-like carrier n=1 Tax=Sinorhizobium numidicum TaxID=680248 RepID=A0ABY8CN61_9HYPH|nr:quinoprotein dehydrogenase-associated SoxYZ-like carrier [Sinorhizobium numidicum]WEX74079.1 quinoprotein dehydrogenase-associated SoxYZ-like carrier [Sinorhizobium numidicum]WEX80064.1 quinoprotein dehydrogenase-associated SoxYZ-like carrier [Sinorhizobium numidicum]